MYRGPGVYRGPPEVYRGPCMKNMRWNTHITYTRVVGQIPLCCPARYQVAAQFATTFRYIIELATSSRAGLQPAREMARELLASWPKTCVCTWCACRRSNSITLSSSLAGRCPPCDQIASRYATSSRAGRRPASEQDSVMEYGLNRSYNLLSYPANKQENRQANNSRENSTPA